MTIRQRNLEYFRRLFKTAIEHGDFTEEELHRLFPKLWQELDEEIQNNI